MKRYLLEYVDKPEAESLWFDSKFDLDRVLDLIRGCPVDDGPIKLRVTTFEATYIEMLRI